MFCRLKIEFAYCTKVFAICLLLYASLLDNVNAKRRKARIASSGSGSESVVQFIDIQDCQALPDGIHPDPTDCHRYFHCSRGKTYYFRCYDGFVFHPCLLKCSFRESCVEPDSCDKNSKAKNETKKILHSTTSTSEPTQQTTEIFSRHNSTTSSAHDQPTSSANDQPTSSAQDHPTSSAPGQPTSSDSLTLPNSTPIVLIHSKSAVATTSSTAKQNLERLGVQRNEPETAEHFDDKVNLESKESGDGIPVFPVSSSTSDPTLTYIVRVVFAKRTQQANLDFSSTTVTSNALAIYKENSTFSKENATFSEPENNTLVLNNTTIVIPEIRANLTIINETMENVTNFADERNFSNESTSDDYSNSSNKTNATVIAVNIIPDQSDNNSSAINNTTTSIVDEKFQNSTMINSSSVISDKGENETTTAEDSVTNSTSTTATFDESTSNNNSLSLIAENNKIEDNALFIKTEYVSPKVQKVEKSTTLSFTEVTTTTAAESTTLSVTTTEGERSTVETTTTSFVTEVTTTVNDEEASTVANKTRSTLKNSVERSDSFNGTNESNFTILVTEQSTTIPEELENQTTSIFSTTLEFDARAREVISNITISCNPAISSAMCDSFNNMSKDALQQKCQQLTCFNGGMFISLSNGHCGCVCPQGMRGEDCQQLADPASCHCANGGRCVQVGNDSYSCMCPLGLLGAQCQYSLADIRPKVSSLIQLPPGVAASAAASTLQVDFSNYILCSTNVCLNGGLCLQQVKRGPERRKCFCSDNYGGEYCEKQYS